MTVIILYLSCWCKCIRMSSVLISVLSGKIKTKGIMSTSQNSAVSLCDRLFILLKIFLQESRFKTTLFFRIIKYIRVSDLKVLLLSNYGVKNVCTNTYRIRPN